jgi:competence protein ComEC
VNRPAAPEPAPTDLRLVPAALSAWVAAAVGVGLTVPAAASAAAGSAVLALVLLVREAVLSLRRAAPVPGARSRHRGHGAVVGGAVLALAAAAACLGVVAAVTHARTGGWWGELVRASATVEVDGVVRSEPAAFARRDAGSSSVRVRLEVREVSGRGAQVRTRAPVLVLGPAGPEGSGWAGLDVGQRVRTVGRLTPTPAGDDVVALLLVADDPAVVGRPSAVARVVAGLRDGLVARTGDLEPDAAGLVPGIAIGDTSRLPADLEEAMRVVSLTHVTAVSGAHVAIILGAILALTGWVRAGPRAALCATALVGFVVLVRPEPSVQRAAAMGAVVVLGLLLGRAARAMPALAASVVVLVLLDPWIARSYGFALSVLATAGLVLVAPRWSASLSRHAPSWLAHGIAVPAAAQAACGPVIILLEPAVAMYAVPANLLAAPAVPPATVLGVLATLCGPWWPAGADALAEGAGACAAWIAAVARRLSMLPAARLPWPGGIPGALLLAAVPALLAVVLRWWGHRRPRQGRPLSGRAVALAGVAAALAVAALVAPGPGRVVSRLIPGALPPDWAVVACDVGQGTAVLVRSGPASAVMIDVGPEGGAADRCLDAAGVASLDLLVLTHLHADHVGGLDAVVASRPVAAALVTPYPRPAESRAAVAAVLSRAGVPVATPAVGPALDVGSPPRAGQAGSVRWDVLAPRLSAVASAYGEDGSVVNDMSLALLLRAPGVTVAALGDLEIEGQGALAASVRRARAAAEASAPARAEDVDVVIVAHHGSARQDEGLAQLLAAELALVSVGSGNDYGHPAPSALSLYERTGATVLRTDLCGSIAVVSGPSGPLARC